jgi:hypothetical protein
MCQVRCAPLVAGMQLRVQNKMRILNDYVPRAHDSLAGQGIITCESKNDDTRQTGAERQATGTGRTRPALVVICQGRNANAARGHAAYRSAVVAICRF